MQILRSKGETMTIFGNGQEADPFPGERDTQQRKQPMSEHTPLPWHVGSTGNFEMVMGFKDGREVIIAELGLEDHTSLAEDVANAALIVEAVNSHAALKARIEE